MASGVDISKYPRRVVSSMVSQKLDSELAEYYKLLAILHGLSGNFEKAQEAVKEYIRIAIPEFDDAEQSKRTHLETTMANMDKWKLEIVPSSIPKKTTGFISRKEQIDFTPKKRKRRK